MQRSCIDSVAWPVIRFSTPSLKKPRRRAMPGSTTRSTSVHAGRRLLTLRILRFAELGPQRPATQLVRRGLLLGRGQKGSRRSLSGPALTQDRPAPAGNRSAEGRRVKSCIACSPTGGLNWDATTVSKIGANDLATHGINRFAYANRRPPRPARKQRKLLTVKMFAYANGGSRTPTLAR